MSATAAGIATKTGANPCGEKELRGMSKCMRNAASRQAAEGERVALHPPNGNSPKASTFAGAGSGKPCAGNDMPASAACAANSLSCNLLAANSLRGLCSRTGSENAAEIGKDLTRIPTLVRWCKFNFVGAVGIGVQFGVLYLLKSVLSLDYLAATALAVEAAVVHNFFWHERFTWADRIKSDRMRPSCGGHPSGAKAQNLLSSLFAALKRCTTQKRATENCATEARERPKSKAAGKSARSTQANTYKLIQKCATRKLHRGSFARFVRFNLTTGLVSIAGNLGMMRVMVGRVHMNYLFANGIAILVCSLVNFVVSDGWVFGEKKLFRHGRRGFARTR
jgi:putative flippase GtrA